MNSAVGRLVQAELRLMVRDPLVLTFVVAFPIVTIGNANTNVSTSGSRVMSLISARTSLATAVLIAVLRSARCG